MRVWVKNSIFQQTRVKHFYYCSTWVYLFVFGATRSLHDLGQQLMYEHVQETSLYSEFYGNFFKKHIQIHTRNCTYDLDHSKENILINLVFYSKRRFSEHENGEKDITFEIKTFFYLRINSRTCYNDHFFKTLYRFSEKNHFSSFFLYNPNQ